MTNQLSGLPHHKLIAYGAAVKLLLAVRAAKSAALNCAEGAGRVSRADKARAFTIARGEAVEAVAAVELAALCGDASPESAAECVALAHPLVAMLTRLLR